jgi:hypothetical protein
MPMAPDRGCGEYETVVGMTYPPMYSFKSPGTLSMRAMTTKRDAAGEIR